jgi:hypothetical protein
LREYEETEITVVKKESVPSSVTCNKCGKSQKLHGEDYQRNWQAGKYQSFYCSFGYGSSYDMERWDFDLCESCLTDLVHTFKIVPNGFGEDDYTAWHPQIMFDEWKTTGSINLEAGMTQEELEENGGSIYKNDGEEIINVEEENE